jgi:tetratricopeptide (TPR) repeat protein
VVALALIATGAVRCHAADEFLLNLRKADLRAEPEERIEYYSRAIRAWRTGHGAGLLAHCHFNRGETYLLEARLDLAEKDLTKALALDPGVSRAYLLRGRLHLRAGRPRSAERDLRESVSMKPEDPEGRLLLGASRERGGRIDEALKDYRQAARLDPASWKPHLCQARALTLQRRFVPAGQALAKAASLAGGREPEVPVQRGALLAETLELSPAADALGEGISLYEERAAELQRSTIKALELQECREALAAAYALRGRIREKLLDPAGALSDYREACRLGHAASCSLAERLAKEPPQEAAPQKPKPAPEAATPPKPKPPKRKRLPKPASDPGERIYGS